ncbi:MAG: tetratricopeptide repeat protein [Desulfobacteraceae bacterium]|nr:MAG: tetratricopeptide repeat protein [Desulfobacteraceae bacterium]
MPMMINLKPSQKTFLIVAGIVLVTLAVYWQVRGFEFISFDDALYVSENKQVRQGLTPQSLAWAFSHQKNDDQTYWHPLTWMSHMLDVELFGLSPGGHHLMNLAFHLINALLLFLALRLMTGAVWKSAFVTALFALHPINVESVAWVAGRKNLLSSTFWMLTILAYIRYARKPNILRYLLVFFTLALGLLAKPMLVTLPCVLLLLDFWPLGRMKLGQIMTDKTETKFQHVGIFRLVMEKIPLLGLSLVTIGLATISPQIINEAAVPMPLRAQNALVSCCQYLWKLFSPLDLAIFYPFPSSIPFWQPFAAGFLLILISSFAAAGFRKFPYLTVGWFWFLGTLFPVMGFVQAGLWPALADRWAYVPAIGVFIMIAWGAPVICKFCRIDQKYLLVPATAILCLLTMLTFRQAGHWKTSESLYTHTLRVKPANPVILNNLGNAVKAKGRLKESVDHYLKALSYKPGYADANYNLANAMKDMGKTDQAIYYYQKTIRVKPDHAKAHNNLASQLMSQGRTAEAISRYKTALQINPDYESAHYNLGIAYYNTGNKQGAVASFKKALRLNPGAAHLRSAMDQAMQLP